MLSDADISAHRLLPSAQVNLTSTAPTLRSSCSYVRKNSRSLLSGMMSASIFFRQYFTVKSYEL
jgi:hypothetical protein